MKEKSTAQRYVSQDGLTIYYWTTWDKSMKKPFKVLHPGSAMNHSSLENLERGLNERGHPTITFDPRGSGYSDCPIPRKYFTLDAVTGDLAGIIAKEGVDNPSIIGHSFGFMPAVEYATKNPVSDIVGICGSYHFPSTAPSKLLFHLFDKGIIYTEYLGSAYTSMCHKLKGTKRLECTDQTDKTLSDLGIWFTIVDIPLKTASSHVFGQREINTWDITKQLTELTTPLLLIYGEKDPMVRPFAGEHIKFITNASCRTFTIPKATHALPLNNFDGVLELIDKYGPKV